MTTLSLVLLTVATADVGATPSRGVLLDFTATWCGPCQQMNPIVSRLKRQGYPVKKVDVDRERHLAQQYRVTSMPTFILVVDGREQNRIVGMTSEAQLRRMLAQIPTTPRPNRQPVQVAENTAPSPPASKGLGFVFPFGGNRKKSPPAETEPPIIRAKLDEDKTIPAVDLKDDPLASSVRIRITTENGVNFGSGTILASRIGHTVILTCGHIFRDLPEDAKIEVDYFAGSDKATYIGKTIGFDLEGDVGLLSINTDQVLPASPIATQPEQARVRQSVYSIGCGGGEPPSREDLFVTALNRYLGPDNIECTGQPMQGRSGGGLFNNDGNVVGVCVAADPRDHRGLYAGLDVVHEMLTRHNLADLIPVVEPTDEVAPPSLPVAPPEKTAVAKGSDVLPAGVFDENGEAEVICIVRPLNKPKSASRVVIINRASPRFVSYLTEEVNNQPIPTVLRASTTAPEDREPPPFAPRSRTKTENMAARPIAIPPRVQRYRRKRS